MSIFKSQNKNYSFTVDEMDEMGEIILEAEKIRSDDKLYRLVQQHLEEKSKAISSIKDIRDRMAEEDLGMKARHK